MASRFLFLIALIFLFVGILFISINMDLSNFVKLGLLILAMIIPLILFPLQMITGIKWDQAEIDYYGIKISNLLKKEYIRFENIEHIECTFDLPSVKFKGKDQKYFHTKRNFLPSLVVHTAEKSYVVTGRMLGKEKFKNISEKIAQSVPDHIKVTYADVSFFGLKKGETIVLKKGEE